MGSLQALTETSEGKILIAIRLVTIFLIVIMLIIHIKYTKMFRWETIGSGGIMITYLIVLMGFLIFSSSTKTCTASVFQLYIFAVGVLLFLMNASLISWRWNTEQNLQLLAELLLTLGIQLKIQLWMKVIMSILIAMGLMANLVFIIICLKNANYS